MEQNQVKINWTRFVDEFKSNPGATDLVGLSGSADAFALSRICHRHRVPVTVIAQSPKSAERLLSEFRLFLEGTGTPVLYLPEYNLSAYKSIAYHNETAGHRLRTLYQLIEGQTAQIVVTTIGAVAKKLLPKDALIQFCELVLAGEELDRDALVRKMVAGGYSRTMIVEEPGDFVVRGGILDVFSPLYDHPIRIEMFGDIVESIRFFSEDTQRTIKEVSEVVVLPAREAILPLDKLNVFAGNVRARALEQGIAVSKVRDIVQRIKDDGLFPGIEGLLPLIYSELNNLCDYLPKHSIVALLEPSGIKAVSEQLEKQIQKNYQEALKRQMVCQEPSRLYFSFQELKDIFLSFQLLFLKSISIAGSDNWSGRTAFLCETSTEDTSQVRQKLIAFQAAETPFQPLADFILAQKKAGCSVLIVCRRPGNIDRLSKILSGYGLHGAVLENMTGILDGQARLYLLLGDLASGFIWPEARFCFLSDEEIFGASFRLRKSKKRSNVSEILDFADLKQNDLVVHKEHGIGQYQRLVKLRVQGLVNDFLLMIYRDGDKFYLPVERMNQIQKYMGVDGYSPLLDKMGGKTWDKLKEKVKRSTEKIAGELLKVYATRKVRKGYSFGQTDMQFQEFIDGFAYEETIDQYKAIDDVLEDMRKPFPMDRLVCGDVGYGKTEVALRAAFLAVSEAKQVAILVPTTVLAEQHMSTFQERFKRYPVQVSCLSRFRSLKEQRDIINCIGQGSLDIVVGTHRLLQKDIVFKDLGLLILDEEHRFGVRHKEKIKHMRETIDVLTLTATPIPRTLHLSMLGVRDISVISTPPEQRRPIVTFVSEFEDSIVAEAIEKELKRGGQVFFVHNHVKSIDRMAEYLQKLAPVVKLAVAHGQMEENQLEEVMHEFVEKRIDMLVCTTIIESGLDVASANTILINRADHFGLAQIYQLRGRVGRSDEQAYAYLFIPPESVLTKDAQKRLKVLMEHSDLGSGFQIAMSDLKIRGGGSILGASQSGHIAAVGYDMFLKLMESSIAELKGEPLQEDLDPEINLPVSAFLPETYIPDIDQRLSLYRRLARMSSLKPISELKAEMQDRFGHLPEQAANLLLKIMLKVLAIRSGCKRVDLTDKILNLHFSQVHQKRPYGIVEMVTCDTNRYRFSPDHVFTALLKPGSSNQLLSQAKNILIEIARHVNQ
ncbi:MAG: transcription-repair coupling factor [Desulfobacteraceae bacterium]|nr:transcription-repair coupling factor [Desulfobacteraceae bacterium]